MKVPFDYGKIPVEIYRIKTRLTRNRSYCTQLATQERVLLVYPYTYSDGYMVVCPIINRKNRFIHMRMNAWQFQCDKNNKVYEKVRNIAEVRQYLSYYCAHFHISLRYFNYQGDEKWVEYHVQQEEGEDECPCKKAFIV